MTRPTNERFRLGSNEQSSGIVQYTRMLKPFAEDVRYPQVFVQHEILHTGPNFNLRHNSYIKRSIPVKSNRHPWLLPRYIESSSDNIVHFQQGMPVSYKNCVRGLCPQKRETSCFYNSMAKCCSGQHTGRHRVSAQVPALEDVRPCPLKQPLVLLLA